MIPLHLTSAQAHALRVTLRSSHSISVRLMVLNMAGEVLNDVSERLIGGQVDVDRDADVTRSCSVELLDIGRTLSFDSDSPHETALYMDRMLRVVYSVRVTTNDIGWVDIPIFTGPIVGVRRADDIVSVDCQGKESLSMGQAWRPMTFRKGARKVDVIRSILRNRGGENKFDMPEFRQRLGKDLSLGRESVPWEVATRLAKSMDKQLFYDGRGVARLRNLPKNPVYNFRAGDDGNLLTEPHVSYSMAEFSNLIWVKGGIPKGAKEAVSFWFSVPRAHPLSPERLGRNGVPRYLLEVVEEESIRSRAEAREVATTKLEDQLRETVEVSFDTLPVPMLEPGDLVDVSTGEYSGDMRIGQFSIPLTVGNPMTVGYTRKLGVSTRAGGRVKAGAARSGKVGPTGAEKKKARAADTKRRLAAKKKAHRRKVLARKRRRRRQRRRKRRRARR